MSKLLFVIILLWMWFGGVAPAQAANNSYISIVNPIRGEDFWDNSFDVWSTTNEQIKLLKENNLEATFLIRPDVFLKEEDAVKAKSILENFEKGIFLEVTPRWANNASINYHQNGNWHAAESVFLTGYTQGEREKLIDYAFDGFKSVFGYYPKSVGAWWVDSYSIHYMLNKYKIQAVLVVADQYSTDNYQVWGQYFGYPYYPSKTNALFPAQEVDSKLPVVMMQWAARDPVNGYGKGVEESTLSVQANDYVDYHDLSTDYFGRLINIYLDQPLNRVNQIVIGLENSYSFQKYGQEYENQLTLVSDLAKKGQIKVLDMEHFSTYYKQFIPGVSPDQIIIGNDPMGGNKKSVWFMNPYYRASWVWNGQNSLFRDVRQYIKDQPEPCYVNSCKSINFATGAVRVMDEVTNGLSYVLDDGTISDLSVSKLGENYILRYKNAAGKERVIGFLARDISIDNKISTIDGLILQAQIKGSNVTKRQFGELSNVYSNDILGQLFSGVKFIFFVLIAIIIPGIGVLSLLRLKYSAPAMITLAGGFGLVDLVLIDYFLGRFGVFYIYLYVLVMFMIGMRFLIQNIQKTHIKFKIDDVLTFILVIVGSLYWCIPVFRSGSLTPYGLGFWGPNGHDGIWHLAVAESIAKGIPPENPIFAGEILKNYHYLFDVLLAITHQLSGVDLMTILFKFMPLLFGILIGLGVWGLVKILVERKLIVTLSLVLVYFTGSFGWIVEYFRSGTFSGESAFWVNQPISINLNPPFAFSLIVLISIFLLFYKYFENRSRLVMFGIILLGGSLIGIKVYAFILLIVSLGLVGFFDLFQKKFGIFYILFGLGVVAGLIILPNYDLSPKVWSNIVSGTFIFSPWWFVHTMVEYQDRVGWLKLAQARVAYFQREEWLKYLFVEGIGFLLFFIGNLGVRVVAFLGLIRLRKICASEIYKLIFCLTILGMIIPMFIIQSGTAWNTIQFFYYSLPFLAIGCAVVLVSLVDKLPKTIGYILLIFFILVGSINSAERALSYFNGSPHASVPFEELAGLDFLKQQSPGTILTVPYSKDVKNRLLTPWPLMVYNSTAYVSALSGMPVYMDDEMQNEILGNDYVRRRVAAKDFFSSPNKQFLNKNSIKYIYLPKIYNLSIPADELGFSNIFANKEVIIYSQAPK